MRVGLVGTGYWARETHAAAVVAEPGLDLAGVWGRRPAEAAALADAVGTQAFDDVGALIDEVDALAFAVPPSVQADIALRAARRGKHLLLEKPIAMSSSRAAELADAVADNGVASIVFFTHRFHATQRRWLEKASRTGGWEYGWGMWLGDALQPGSPFATPWRHEKDAALWDLGPHALSLLCGALGPVGDVSATPGARGLVHLVLTHVGGATSTVALTLSAATPSTRTALTLWGPSGFSDMPEPDAPVVEALRRALRELREQVESGAPGHPCDVHFGRSVVDVLEQAERQLSEQA